MRTQSLQAYRLQGFWGFPALLFVLLERFLTICLLVANRIPWQQHLLGPESYQGLVQQMSFPHSVAHLSCVTHFLGSTLSLVLVRCSRSNPLDEKDNLGEQNGNLSLLGIKATFGTWVFVLVFFSKNPVLPSPSSPCLFFHHLKNGAPWTDAYQTPKTELICSRRDALQAWSRNNQDFLSDCCIHPGRFLSDKCVWLLWAHRGVTGEVWDRGHHPSWLQGSMRQCSTKGVWFTK